VSKPDAARRLIYYWKLRSALEDRFGVAYQFPDDMLDHAVALHDAGIVVKHAADGLETAYRARDRVAANLN
jgi:hypothetical protein